MRREPENGDVQVAGTSLLSLLLIAFGGRRAKPARLGFSLVFPIYPRGGGKVENLLLVFHFSIAFVAGAVGMWESRLPLARFPRGSWKEWEACSLAFHAFHSPGISTALVPHRVVRQRANKLSFAFCIRRAASVSLRASD